MLSSLGGLVTLVVINVILMQGSEHQENKIDNSLITVIWLFIASLLSAAGAYTLGGRDTVKSCCGPKPMRVSDFLKYLTFNENKRSETAPIFDHTKNRSLNANVPTDIPANNPLS